jgi:MFS superfamily sulfate permease-like transporter
MSFCYSSIALTLLIFFTCKFKHDAAQPGFARLLQILPWPVMIGFVNGLAIVIGISQLGLSEGRRWIPPCVGL